jgi:predicted RNA-binding Zn ribbon-like protein
MGPSTASPGSPAPDSPAPAQPASPQPGSPQPEITLNAAPREDTCLDYANTCMWRGTATPVDQLAALTDVLNQVVETAGLPPETAAALRTWAAANPYPAGTLFVAAIALREAIYRIFSAISSTSPVPDADIAALNRALAEAPPRAGLTRLTGAYAWHIEPTRLSAPALLAPILWSAADLLVQVPQRRIRQCANPQCLWLFIDASKNGTRRWCDMTACGNRAKAHRHYLKSKQR